MTITKKRNPPTRNVTTKTEANRPRSDIPPCVAAAYVATEASPIVSTQKIAHLTESAALFAGNVAITGSLTVQGSYPKSAAVKKRDGTLARMYCQEAPEPWFVDFGRGQIKDGKAVVDLDPELDQVVKGDDYHVFLTEYGDLRGLYVADVRPHRFEVRSRDGAAANGSFGYRVVARPLDDVGGRMEKVERPKLPTIDLERPTRGTEAALAEPARPQPGVR